MQIKFEWIIITICMLSTGILIKVLIEFIVCLWQPCCLLNTDMGGLKEADP